MTSMISGTVGSYIIPGGIGYNTTYLPEFLHWRKEGTCLTDLIIKSGFDMIIHNHVPWMSHNIIGTDLTQEEKTQHYRDYVADNTNTNNVEVFDFGVLKRIKCEGANLIYSSTHPDLTLNTFVEWGSFEQKQKFYNNEIKYFSHIKAQFNGLLWTDLCHWHKAIYYPYHKNPLPINRDDALRDSIKWLQSFDFNEPDTIFFIYADHSHRVESYLDPPGYITWAYWKDNRDHPEILRPVIFILLFFRSSVSTNLLVHIYVCPSCLHFLIIQNEFIIMKTGGPTHLSKQKLITLLKQK